MTAGTLRRLSAYGDADGFALLDVLVALALISFVGGLLVGGLQFAIRAADFENDRSSSEEVDAGVARIREWLEFAMALPSKNLGARSSGVAFSGSAEEVRFVTLSEATALPGGPVQLTLAVDRGRSALVAIATVARSQEYDQVQGVVVTLLPSVRRWRLQYYGLQTGESEAAWQSSWDGVIGLPRAVRAWIEFDNGVFRGRRMEVITASMKLGQR